MGRRYFWMTALAAVLGLFVFTGCPTETDPEPDPEIPSSPRREIVWAGPWDDPSGAVDWITLTFKSAYNDTVLVYGEDGKPVVENGDFVEELVYRNAQAIIQFASETDPKNMAHTEYTYDKKTGTGSIPKPIRDSPPVDYAAPGAFTIASDEKSICFENFQGSGLPLTLYKLYPDRGKIFKLADLSADLENTVWAGTGFRSEDWITLSFRGAGGGMIVQVGHVADSTQWSRTYTYSEGTKTGSIFSVGGFEILDNGTKLRAESFYGHGAPVDLKRVR